MGNFEDLFVSFLAASRAFGASGGAGEVVLQGLLVQQKQGWFMLKRMLMQLSPIGSIC